MKELIINEHSLNLDEGNMAYYIGGQEGKRGTLVFLHGWGQSFYSFENVANSLLEDFLIIGVDFLGFGLSDEPDFALRVDDYTNHLELLLNELGIVNPIIIAHSFGGRIALLYSSRNKVDKLFLVNAAGIRDKSIGLKFKIFKYKLKKVYLKIFKKSKLEELYSKSGSLDYRNASTIMKKTLSLNVNRKLKKEMKLIKTKTYIIWGILDSVLPYSDAKRMEKLINDSKIIPFYNSGHFTYLEEERKFIRCLKQLL